MVGGMRNVISRIREHRADCGVYYTAPGAGVRRVSFGFPEFPGCDGVSLPTAKG